MKFSNCKFKISKNKELVINDLELPTNGCIAFVGANGSGKTSLAKAFSRELIVTSGSASIDVNDDIARISFEKQQKLIEDDYITRSRGTATEKEQYGITPRDLLYVDNHFSNNVDYLCEKLDLTKLLDRPYYVLSSGEGRKVLIAQAILENKNILIMDAPFDGLDSQTRVELMNLFYSIYESNKLLILIVNRYDEIPLFADFIGVISDCELVKYGARNKILADLEFMQLKTNEDLNNVSIPKIPSDSVIQIIDGPLVEMEDVVVRYQDHIVIDHLSMTIEKGQHWQISGPNGAGKSTLLSLITGDHPQGYSNKLKLFGKQRGSGETIWDIKKNIGYVSPSFHLSYRVSCSVLNVILSGYFDSIGLYEKPGDEKIMLAKEWLKILGLETVANIPFSSLSFGQQRLLLIARALVKHPPLLILDEPLQGLDSISRLLVKKFVEYLMKENSTQVLFVSHHVEDAPNGITNRLEFVSKNEGGYKYLFT